MTCMERGKKKRHIRKGDIRHIWTVDMMEKGHKVHSKKTYRGRPTCILTQLLFEVPAALGINFVQSTSCIGHSFFPQAPAILHQLHRVQLFFWAQLHWTQLCLQVPAASSTASLLRHQPHLVRLHFSGTSCIRHSFSFNHQLHWAQLPIFRHPFFKIFKDITLVPNTWIRKTSSSCYSRSDTIQSPKGQKSVTYRYNCFTDLNYSCVRLFISARLQCYYYVVMLFVDFYAKLPT